MRLIKSLLLLAISCQPLLLFAQSNSFPSDGNVGVGTTGAETRLDVNGHVQIDSTRNGYGGFRIEEEGSGDYNVRFMMGRGGSNGGFRFYSNYRPMGSGSWGSGAKNHLMSILGSGYVGIRTENPEVPLDVNGHVQIDSTRNGYGGFRIEEEGSGDYNVRFMMGRGGGNGGFRFYSNYRPMGSGSWGSGAKNHLMTILGNGNVGIGVSNPQYKLSVKGRVVAGAFKVVDVSQWHDYVLEESYSLMPLDEVQAFIKKNKHLPHIPSEKEVTREGFDIAEMQGKLLMKIEELTLYIINQDERIAAQETELKELRQLVQK